MRPRPLTTASTLLFILCCAGLSAAQNVPFLTPDWRTPYPVGGAVLDDDQNVYMLSSKQLSAVNVQNGKVLWRRAVALGAGDLSNRVALMGSTLYVLESPNKLRFVRVLDGGLERTVGLPKSPSAPAQVSAGEGNLVVTLACPGYPDDPTRATARCSDPEPEGGQGQPWAVQNRDLHLQERGRRPHELQD